MFLFRFFFCYILIIFLQITGPLVIYLKQEKKETNGKTETDREPLRKKGGSGGRQQRERGVGELEGENCRSGIMEDYRAGAGAWCGGARES